MSAESEDILEIQNSLGKQMFCTSCLSYERLAADGKIFSCISFSLRFIRNNSVFHCVDWKTKNILRIVKICFDCTFATEDLPCWDSNQSNCLEISYVFIGERIQFKRHFPILDEHTLIDLGTFITKIIPSVSLSLKKRNNATGFHFQIVSSLLWK